MRHWSPLPKILLRTLLDPRDSGARFNPYQGQALFNPCSNRSKHHACRIVSTPSLQLVLPQFWNPDFYSTPFPTLSWFVVVGQRFPPANRVVKNGMFSFASMMALGCFPLVSTRTAVGEGGHDRLIESLPLYRLYHVSFAISKYPCMGRMITTGIFLRVTTSTTETVPSRKI